MLAFRYVFCALLCSSAVTPFVVVPDTPINDEPVVEVTTIHPETQAQVRHFIVESNIKYRYARTLISSRVVNPATVAQEVFFEAVLPETAFISNFKLIIGNEVYEAYVKEKEKAKEEYAQAVSEGRTAGHVALSARDSNRVVVSVNVAPTEKVTFNLTYEELLTRKLSAYHHVLNLDPGQIVNDLRVTVKIEEASEITSVHVPPLRVSNEILDDSNDGSDPWVHIDRPSPHSAVITWTPTADQQRELAREGIKGQLEVKYDVSRSESGEIMVIDGYFVHFFAPEGLTPMAKHVVFVLDMSGSMYGRKIEQLKQAMSTILEDLREGDYFSLIFFSSRVYVWNSEVSTNQQMQDMVDPDKQGEDIPNIPSSAIVAVNSENIEKAKDFLDRLPASGSTNIYDALRTGLEAVNIGRSVILNVTESSNTLEDTNVPEPLIVFLTDGQANQGGVTEPAQIVGNITNMNTKTDSIFCLSLGSDADFDFLKKLSLRNAAFARKIYEAADTALQLRDFYRQVSSPLLAHVNFTYPQDQIDAQSMTKANFRRLFGGSEIVVAGRLASTDVNQLSAEVNARAPTGMTKFNFVCNSDTCHERHPPPQPDEVSNTTSALERLWAYLTIQQLLEKADSHYDFDYCDDYDCEEEETPSKQRALELALRYSFVTPLTSLVVVKPNDTTSNVQTQDAAQLPQPLPSQGIRGASQPAHHSIAFPGARAPFGPVVGSGGAPYSAAGPGVPYNAADRLVPEIAAGGLPGSVTFDYPSFVPLANLNDITWLNSALNDSNLQLPTGPDSSVEHLKLASANQTNEAYEACTTPAPHTEPGHCRHLQYCVLTYFTSSLQDYIPYLCRIEGQYAGVCCPDSLQPSTIN